MQAWAFSFCLALCNMRAEPAADKTKRGPDRRGLGRDTWEDTTKKPAKNHEKSKKSVDFPGRIW